MAYRCDICDKKTEAGRNNRHHKGVAGKRWLHRAQRTLRSFKPNLHWVTLPISGNATRIRACAKCIKRVKFDNKKATEVQTPVAALA